MIDILLLLLWIAIGIGTAKIFGLGGGDDNILIAIVVIMWPLIWMMGVLQAFGWIFSKFL